MRELIEVSLNGIDNEFENNSMSSWYYDVIQNIMHHIF